MGNSIDKDLLGSPATGSDELPCAVSLNIAVDLEAYNTSSPPHFKRKSQSFQAADTAAKDAYSEVEVKRPRLYLHVTSSGGDGNVDIGKSPSTSAGFRSPVGGSEALLSRDRISDEPMESLRQIIHATPLSSDIKGSVLAPASRLHQGNIRFKKIYFCSY